MSASEITEQTSKRITDVIGIEYSDFLEYCETAGKVFTFELTNVDYVAFRTSSAQSRDYINKIKTIIENPVSVRANTIDGKELTSAGNQDVENVDLDGGKPDAINADSEPYPFASQEIQSIASDDKMQICEDFETAPGGPPTLLDSIPAESKICEHLESRVPLDIQGAKEEFVSAATIDFQHTLAYGLSVEALNFSDVDIGRLYLNVRAMNCLNAAGFKTLADVLNSTPDDLQRIRNMGAKTVDEIIQKSKSFVSNSFALSANKISLVQSSHRIPMDVKYNTEVKKLLTGEICSTEGMTDIQIEHFEKLRSAIEIIGEEASHLAYVNPTYTMQICNMLMVFAAPYIAYQRFCDKVNLLSDFLKERKAIPFIKAYMARGDVNLDFLLNRCSEDTTIIKIPALYRTWREERDAIVYIHATNLFLDWLNFNLDDLILSISNRISTLLEGKSERYLDVFTLRLSGHTLEEIGSKYGVTRERIRQIEKKVFRSFWAVYSKQRYDLIMLAYALRDGDSVLYFNDLKDVFGDFAFLLWGCEKHEPNHKSHYYSKALDAIVIYTGSVTEKDAASLITKAKEIINTIPCLISVEEVEKKLVSMAAEEDLPLAILENVFKATFIKSGEFYHRNYLTVTLMCEYVLKQRFETGFKIADDFEANRFKQYLKELFGDRSASITNRAIDARVGEIGVLCDRGKYIHPDYMQVEQNIIDAVNLYIEQSSRDLLTYGEIFEGLKDTLKGTQITNRYLLQGALKKYGCKFSSGRNFIRKKQSTTFVDELESFVEERGVVHKSEIFAEFTSLRDANLGQIIARSSNVFNIDGGYYLHASQFDIQPEDYEQIRKYLTEACRDIPVNIRSVYETIAVQFPGFMYRNDFEDRNKLFAALNYMFRGEFTFSRPYIAKLGESDISNRSVILQHIKDYDSIEIEELIDICEENNIHYVTSSYLCQSVAPDFVRISKTTLMRREFTGITDEIIAQTIRIVGGILKSNEYIVGSKVNDFLWFPQTDVDWNEFLLESIIVQSKEINIVYLVGDPLKHSNAVYVSDKYKDDTFDSLLLKILTDEVRKGTFTSKIEMREWLKEMGFIEGKLPKLLESAKYFYVNDTGVHCTGE